MPILIFDKIVLHLEISRKVSLFAWLVRSSLSHICLEPSGNYRCSTPSKRRIRYGSGLHLVHRTAKAGYIILGSSDVTRNTRGCATRTKPSSVTLTFSSVIAVRALRLLIDAAGERDTHSILTSTAVTRAHRVYGPLSASGREKKPVEKWWSSIKQSFGTEKELHSWNVYYSRSFLDQDRSSLREITRERSCSGIEITKDICLYENRNIDITLAFCVRYVIALVANTLFVRCTASKATLENPDSQNQFGPSRVLTVNNSKA